MRRTYRLSACSAAVVGLASLLGACDAGAPTASAPDAAQVSAPAASLSPRAAEVQQKRLRDAGRSGLKAGVNSAPSERLQSVVLEKAPPGLERRQSAPAFRVQKLRLGEAARPSAEQMAAHRARGGESFFEGTGTTGGGGTGEIGAANHESWSYTGASFADVWFGGDYVDMGSYTSASKNITYIDVIGDSFADGYYLTTLYHYANNSSFAAAWWTYYAYWYGYYTWYEQYGNHYVYDNDGYGTYAHNFFTSAIGFSW